MSKDESQDILPVSKPNKVRSTSLPFELDQQIVEICKKRGYPSVSEFLREGARKLVQEWEKHTIGDAVWDVIGGPVINQVMDSYQKKSAEMDTLLAQLQHELSGIKSEQRMVKDIPVPDMPDSDGSDEEHY